MMDLDLRVADSRYTSQRGIVGPIGPLDKPGMFAKPIPPVISYEIYIKPTATELRVISQPNGDANLARYPTYYVYENNYYADYFIYYTEMGIEEGYTEFTSRQGQGKIAIK